MSFLELLILIEYVILRGATAMGQNELISPELQELNSDFFNWRVSDMPEFATFIGIHDFNDRWDDMSESAYQNRYNKVSEFLARVQELQPSLTSEVDLINIKALKYELETFRDGFKYKAYYLAINYSEGVHKDLENQILWMPRLTEDDHENILSRFQTMDRRIDQTIQLLRLGVLSGMVNHQISMKNLKESFEKLTVSNPEDSPFYAFFADGFPFNFNATLISQYQSRAKSIIQQKMSPAFRRLSDMLSSEYRPRDHIAVTSLPNGKQLYEQLIKFHTSTNLSAEEIHRLGFKEVDRIEREMKKIMEELGYTNTSVPEFTNVLLSGPKNYYSNGEDLLNGYNKIIFDRIDPKLTSIFYDIPRAQIELKPDTYPGSSAYYVSGTFDGSRPGAFYVSTLRPHLQPKFKMLSLSLHEASPGHHLQNSHAIESPSFPDFRKTLEDRHYGFAPSRFPIPSMAEGWALYAESLGFDMNLFNDNLERFGYYSYEGFRAIRLVVDTGIHAMNWTKEQAVSYMRCHSVSPEDKIQDEIDRYITWPGQALSYKISELKLQELRHKAEVELEEHFDIKGFHQILLESFGPMDLVEEQVDKWIEKYKSKRRS